MKVARSTLWNLYFHGGVFVALCFLALILGERGFWNVVVAYYIMLFILGCAIVTLTGQVDR